MTELLAGKYALERRLGGGGMAEVFLAHTVGAEGFSRRVAIKRVLAGYSESEQFAQMFVAEAQLSARLQHPNVVSVLDFDRDADRRLFLVMELVDGADLDALLATGPLPLPVIVHVTCEILRGLGYAHDLPLGDDGVRGLVHRDVSPHNVLLSWEGATKVSDFGIAKARAASAASASVMIKGKPAYMSPEQANGDALDGRSDLFAVGVMLWEMLCGRPLFAGATTHEMLARVLFAPIPSPRELRPEVPADVERVVMRLLARDRAARYATAELALADLVACADHPRGGRELLVALLAQRFAGRAPPRARSFVGASHDAPTVVGASSTRSTSRAALPPPTAPTGLAARRRGRGGVVVAAGAAILVLAVGAYAWSRGARADGQAPVDAGAGLPALATPVLDARDAPGPPPAPRAADAASPEQGSGTARAPSAPVATDGPAVSERDTPGAPPPAASTAVAPRSTPPRRPDHRPQRPPAGSATGIREISIGD